MNDMNDSFFDSLGKEILGKGRILGACTSRFNGYKYREEEYSSKQRLFDYSQVVGNFELFPSEADNWLAFFMLNREMHLCNFPGDEFSLTSLNRAAIFFLFLHIYRQEPPSSYGNPSSSWYALKQEEIEEFASLIRKFLAHKIYGNRSRK